MCMWFSVCPQFQFSFVLSHCFFPLSSYSNVWLNRQIVEKVFYVHCTPHDINGSWVWKVWIRRLKFTSILLKFNFSFYFTWKFFWLDATISLLNIHMDILQRIVLNSFVSFIVLSTSVYVIKIECVCDQNTSICESHLKLFSIIGNTSTYTIHSTYQYNMFNIRKSFQIKYSTFNLIVIKSWSRITNFFTILTSPKHRQKIFIKIKKYKNKKQYKNKNQQRQT